MLQSSSEIDFDRLRENTLVDEVVYLEKIDSTNNYAKHLEGAAPTLVLCGKQTSGRGRGMNRWQTPEGTLAFSLRVPAEPFKLEQRYWPLTSLFTALALARTFSRWLPDGATRLKWPNDVLLNEKKTAGILLEASADKSAIIIGVGLNYANDVSELQGALDQPATSMLAELGGASLPSVLNLLTGFLQEWSTVHAMLLVEGLAIDSLWSPFGDLKNRPVSLNRSDSELRGLCHGLDLDGALLVETEEGIQRCYSGTGLRVLS